MGNEEPATKADLNHLMAQMDAMMGAIESQKTQLDALTSGTSSTTPPTLVETSDKPSLNEDDPDKVGAEGNEDPPKKDDTSRGHSTEIPHPTSYVSGRHLQMPHLASCSPPPTLDASRPDIMLSVGMCARYQAAPKESHLIAVKRIFRYLIHSPTFGLWYPKGSSFELVGYSDSDWAGDKVDRKSTSGACQVLGRSLVSWSSKKQNCVSLSTTEAKYVSASSCCAQLLWMRQTLKDYGVHCDKVPLLCDNDSAIKIAHNPVQHNKMKHIEIRHHFIRDHVNRGDINLSYVGTNDQLADIFTKPLDEGRL
jgi:hypothetical protein